MTHAILYKYIICTDDKLLALAPVTNYNTNYSKIIIIIIITTTTTTMVIIIIII